MEKKLQKGGAKSSMRTGKSERPTYMFSEAVYDSIREACLAIDGGNIDKIKPISTHRLTVYSTSPCFHPFATIINNNESEPEITAKIAYVCESEREDVIIPKERLNIYKRNIGIYDDYADKADKNIRSRRKLLREMYRSEEYVQLFEFYNAVFDSFTPKQRQEFNEGRINIIYRKAIGLVGIVKNRMHSPLFRLFSVDCRYAIDVEVNEMAKEFFTMQSRFYLLLADFDKMKLRFKDEIVDKEKARLEKLAGITQEEMLKNIDPAMVEKYRREREKGEELSTENERLKELVAKYETAQKTTGEESTRSVGRTPEFLFATANGTKDDKLIATRAAELVEALHGKAADFLVNGDRRNPVNVAFTACYRQWADEKMVPAQPNGAACFRFLTEDCHIKATVTIRSYSNFVNRYPGLFRPEKR